MTPYYDRAGIRLFLGDCREVLPTLNLSKVALVLTDPPYGVNERCDRKAKGREMAAECNDFPPVHGDDKPFDPTHLLALEKPAVIWGANYFAELLPRSPSWIVWDKRDGIPSNDNADCEFAWSNLGGPARIFRHLWNGMIKASEREDRRVHPTQKPVALSQWILERATITGDTILDPYAGSGSALVAALRMERRAIGVEYERAYCDVIAKRIDRELAQGDLFRKAAP